MKLSAPPTADLLLAAYEKHAGEMRDFPDDKLLARVNFDFAAATAIVLGAHPALMEFRGFFREHLPKIPLRYLDELDSITHAALYVYMQSLTAPTPETRIVGLVDKAKPLRKKLQADAAAAVAHELIDESVLVGVPTGNGRLEIAQGLLGLCVAFRASWPKVKGHTAVTEAMLVEATQAGIDLLAALGREENPALASEALPIEKQWLQAVSFFYYAYDRCRLAMSYARWDEGDAGDFAPSLVGPRGPRTKPASEDPDDGPIKTPANPNKPGDGPQ